MTLGEFIKKYRKDTGLSLRELADKCDLSFQYISKLEKDEVDKLSVDTTIKIAKGTGAPMQEILKMVSDVDLPPQYGNAPYRIAREQDKEISDEMLSLYVAYKEADPAVRKAVRLMLKMEE